MKKLRLLISQQSGSAPLWTAFITIVLISFSLLIYTAMAVQTNYQQAQTELERTANISLDASLENPAVRDIQLGIPLNTIKMKFEDNLLEAGYTQHADLEWQKSKNGKVIYTLKDWQLGQENEQYKLTGLMEMHLLWGPDLSVDIPINTTIQILFLDYQ